MERRGRCDRCPPLIPKEVLRTSGRGPRSEIRDFQREHEELDVQAKKDHIAAKRQMGNRVFWLVTIWLAVVILTLWMAATGCFFIHPSMTFTVSDPVMIALITTTTANVALFLTIVIKHLFPLLKETK